MSSTLTERDHGSHVLLDVPPDLSNLPEVRAWVQELATRVPLSEARTFDLQVVVSEAVANAIEHAASAVAIAAWLLPDRLIVEITNDGQFTPGLYKDQESRRRGLGLPLMVSLADQVHVSRLSDQRTQVSLTFIAEMQGPAENAEQSRDEARARLWNSAFKWLVIPIPLLILAVVILEALGVRGSRDSAMILTVFNTLFLTASSLSIVFLAARDYLARGSRSLLYLGAGAIIFTFAYLLAGTLISNPNEAVTIHNTSMMLAGILFACSAVRSMRAREWVEPVGKPGWLAFTLGVGVAVTAALYLAAHFGLIPAFYLQTQAWTPERDAVLGLAVTSFLFAAFCYALLYRTERIRFVLLCSVGFAMLAISLASLLFTHASAGSAVDWLARGGQWLGGIYLFAGVLGATRSGPILSVEKSLHELEGRYSNLVNTSPDAIIVDTRGQCAYANPAAARLLGFESPGDLVGHQAPDFLAPASRKDAVERISQIYSGGTAAAAEERFLRADGSELLADVTRTRVQFDGDLGVQTVVRDITERKRGEEALIESERRYRKLADENQRLYHQQLNIAESLQLALLNIPSEIGPARVGHLYRTATESNQVGGDFYDVFEVKNGHIAMLIGDVAGRGIAAARTATLVRDVVHAFTHQSLRTHEVLRRTNELLVEKELPGFVTLFLAVLDVETGTLRYSSAGHPSTLLRRKTGEILRLGNGSPPLGVSENSTWKARDVGLAEGDLLLLYTDGVTEVRRNDEPFGEERLARIMGRKKIPVRHLPELILNQVLTFSGGVLKDDLAILALSLASSPGEDASAAQTRFKQETLLG